MRESVAGLGANLVQWASHMVTPPSPSAGGDSAPRTRIDRGMLQAELGKQYLSQEQIESGRRAAAAPAALANHLLEMAPGLNALNAAHTLVTGEEFATGNAVSGLGKALAVVQIAGTLGTATQTARLTASTARITPVPKPALQHSTSLSRLAPNTGGQGLIGWVKPSRNIDGSLQGTYEAIANSPKFARDLEAYNRLARRFGQTEAAGINDILSALRTDTAFARVSNPRAGIFVGGQHAAAERFLIQGNPLSIYGPRAARHELVHLGAAIRGQSDNLAHEILVQLSTTPEVGIGLGGGIFTVSVGAGWGIWQLFGGGQQ